MRGQANQPEPKHVTGSFNDPAKIRELAAKCDILTVEIEHVNTEVLEEIAIKGVVTESGAVKRVPVHPSWETLRLVQDKYLQRNTLEGQEYRLPPRCPSTPGRRC